MSISEKLDALSARIKNDDAFFKKLVEQESIEATSDFLKASGFDFSVKDVEDMTQEMVSALDGSELSDDDLAMVAGGAMVRLPAKEFGQMMALYMKRKM